MDIKTFLIMTLLSALPMNFTGMSYYIEGQSASNNENHLFNPEQQNTPNHIRPPPL